MPATTVEFFFDFGSPAAYLAWTQLPHLCADTGATLAPRPMLLGGVFQATGNRSPAEIKPKGPYMNVDLQRFAQRYGVPFTHNPHFPVNTLLLMRGATDLPMPAVPAPEAVERMTIGPKAVAWVGQYEMRPVSGSIPTQWDGRGDHSETRMWLRDAQPRALDFASLTAMSDVFYPRVWLRRATVVPAGTVSITTYFHCTAAQLAEVGTGHLLGRATGQQFAQGFFDQSAQLWSQAGRLLATSNQIVYYKE